MRHFRRNTVLIIAFFSLAGIFGGMYGRHRMQLRADEQIRSDFRIAAGQRATLVRLALQEPIEQLQTLNRFFRSSDEVTRREFDNFIAPWTDDEQGVYFAVLGRDGLRPLLGISPFLPKEVYRSFLELYGTEPGSGPRTKIVGSGTARSAVLISGEVTTLGNREKALILCLVDIGTRTESILGEGSIWGLPTSVRKGEAPGDLLYFHPPRLDALLGSPQPVPAEKPALSLTENFFMGGTALSIQVDASPAYMARVRRIAPAITMPLIFLAALLLGITAAWLEWKLYRADDLASDARTRLELVFRLNPDMLAIVDKEGKFLRVNEAWKECLGYEPQAMEGKKFYDFLAADEENSSHLAMEELEKGERLEDFINHYRAKDGSIHSLEWRSVARNGTVYAAARDATDRLEKEEQLRQALRDKETLLREVHHRVKNNLQIIVSMLSLQQSESEDPLLVSALEQAQNRIRAMALVHESLYHTEDLADMDFQTYAQSLLSIFSAGENDMPSDIKIRSEPVMLSLDFSIHCGLLLNELATNAAKYAFPFVPTPKLRVSLEESAPGELKLSVEDNGPGLPPGFDPEKHGRLGLKLVDALASQAGGKDAEVRYGPGKGGTGTRVVVLLKPPRGAYRLYRRNPPEIV